ncbi:MAG: M23 family metallopeptidase [Gemmatimonadaceae bacterium]
MTTGRCLWLPLAILLALTAACKVDQGDTQMSGAPAHPAPSATAVTSAPAVESTPSAAEASSGTAPVVEPSHSLTGGVVGTGRPPTMPPDSGRTVASPAELRALGTEMVVPVQGVRPADLHDSFDERRGGGSRPHEALDILAPRGTPVLSATAGTLRKKHASVPGGLMIYAADATDRFILMYGHLDRYADGLTEGQPLARGQVIGYVGTTGNAAVQTPHLHFAVARGRPSIAWWRGTPVNPYPLLTDVAAGK